MRDPQLAICWPSDVCFRVTGLQADRDRLQQLLNATEQEAAQLQDRLAAVEQRLAELIARQATTPDGNTQQQEHSYGAQT